MIAWICALVWTLAFAATHMPGNDVPDFPRVSDGMLHLLGYGGLTGMAWLTLWAYGQPMGRRILVCVMLLPLYGVFDELTQSYFHRTADVVDWMHDCLGTAISLVCCELGVLTFRKGRPRGGEPVEIGLRPRRRPVK